MLITGGTGLEGIMEKQNGRIWGSGSRDYGSVAERRVIVPPRIYTSEVRSLRSGSREATEANGSRNFCKQHLAPDVSIRNGNQRSKNRLHFGVRPFGKRLRGNVEQVMMIFLALAAMALIVFFVIYKLGLK